MTADAKWIIGTMLGGMVGMTAILVTLIVNMENRIDARLNGFDARLRAVEVALGKVDQRLATLERLLLPTPEGP